MMFGLIVYGSICFSLCVHVVLWTCVNHTALRRAIECGGLADATQSEHQKRSEVFLSIFKYIKS